MATLIKIGTLVNFSFKKLTRASYFASILPKQVATFTASSSHSDCKEVSSLQQGMELKPDTQTSWKDVSPISSHGLALRIFLRQRGTVLKVFEFAL